MVPCVDGQIVWGSLIIGKMGELATHKFFHFSSGTRGYMVTCGVLAITKASHLNEDNCARHICASPGPAITECGNSLAWHPPPQGAVIHITFHSNNKSAG